MGFVIATGCLHALGIGIGTVHRWAWGQKLLRVAGGLVAVGWRVLYVEGDRMKNASQSRLPLYAFVVFTFVMCALPAEAHLNSTGMGPFYDGLMHFLMSPEDIVPVLALALLAGLRGASYGRRALFTLPVAWLLGGLAGLSAMTATPHPFIAAAWFLLLGGLLAADAKAFIARDYRSRRSTGHLSRILEWNRHGTVRHCRGSAARTGVRGVCPDRPRCSVRSSATRALGSNCRPRRRKLDRSQRSLDAGLGSSNALVQGNVLFKSAYAMRSKGLILAFRFVEHSPRPGPTSDRESVDQQAVAKSSVTDGEAVLTELVHHCLNNARARKNHIRPFGLQPDDCATLLQRL